MNHQELDFEHRYCVDLSTSNYCCCRVPLTRNLVPHYGIQNDKPLAHGGYECHFLGFASLTQSLTKGADGGVPAHGAQGGDVEYVAYGGTATPNMALAAQLATVPVQGRQAHEGRLPGCPSSGSSATSTVAAAGPTPGTLRSNSAWPDQVEWVCSRARISQFRLSKTAPTSKPIWTGCGCAERSLHWPDGSALGHTGPVSCRHRTTSARKACRSASGRGRTGGRIRAAISASRRAFMRSVLASQPEARPTSRA